MNIDFWEIQHWINAKICQNVQNQKSLLSIKIVYFWERWFCANFCHLKGLILTKLVFKTSKSVKVTVFQPSHSSKLISPKTRFKILLKSLTTRLVCKDLNESLWIHDSPLSLCESVGVYMCPFLGFWVLWVFLSISETFLSLCKSFWVSVSLFDFWVSVSFFFESLWVFLSLFSTVWKNEKNTLTEKIFRQITFE